MRLHHSKALDSILNHSSVAHYAIEWKIRKLSMYGRELNTEGE